MLSEEELIKMDGKRFSFSATVRQFDEITDTYTGFPKQVIVLRNITRLPFHVDVPNKLPRKVPAVEVLESYKFNYGQWCSELSKGDVFRFSATVEFHPERGLKLTFPRKLE